MDKIEEIKNLIQKEFLLLEIFAIVKTGEGMHNDAYLVNDQYIFRFPKKQGDKQRLTKEILLLPELKGILNIAVPEFEFIPASMNFAGYKIISGKFLSKESYGAFNRKEKEVFLKEMAAFLTMLHATALKNIQEAGLEIRDYENEYSEDFEQVKKIVFPTLSANEKEAIEYQFKTYLGIKKNFDYTPVLLHNDFSPDHILLDKDTNQLRGVIDFGEAAIGDPDYDLFYLYGDMGKNFIIDLLQYYKHNDHPLLFQKLEFFNLADHLHDTINNISMNHQPAS